MPLPHDFSIYDLGLLPGGTYATPSAVDGNGNVVGVADTKPNSASKALAHAFLWERRTRKMIDLHANFASPAFPGDTSRAADINDFGWIVGSASDADGAEQAFLCKPSSAGLYLPFEALPVQFHKGPYTSAANAINNLGAIVGKTSERPAESDFYLPEEAILWQYGFAVRLTNGELWSEALDVNDRLQVVGQFTSNDNSKGHPFYWSLFAGLTSLGTLGGGYGKAMSVNNSGTVVGESSVDDVVVHGFTYEWPDFQAFKNFAAMKDASPAAPNTSSLQGISDSGETVGAVHLDSATQSFAELGESGAYYDLNALNKSDFRWQLLTATAICSSGEYIVGTGLFGGETRAWIIDTARAGVGMLQDFMRPINFGGIAGGTTRTMGYYPHLVIPHIVDPGPGVFRGR
jgi:uncharacterized membrane protein